MQQVLDTVFTLLDASPAAWVVVIFILSLLVGSFLNVVIHRVPIMLDREWRAQAQEITADQNRPAGAAAADQFKRYNLWFPRSACTRCGTMITSAQNVPVVSYLLLRGKCGKCGVGIPMRYPLVELLTAVLSAVVAWKFGFTWYTAAALFLTWMLVAMSCIDIDLQLLPDNLTLPLLWVGLLISLFADPAAGILPPDPRSAIIGAVAGYLSLWSVYQVFRLLTSKEGMGYGDFKLLAALGAWMGWKMLLPIILLSALAGSVIGIANIALRGRDRDLPIPFGPYLAIAGWIALLWGDTLVGSYLRMSGMRP